MLATHSIVWNVQMAHGRWLMAHRSTDPLRLSAVLSGVVCKQAIFPPVFVPVFIPSIPSLVVRKRITPTDFYSYLRIFIHLRRWPRADVSRGFLILRTSNIQRLLASI